MVRIVGAREDRITSSALKRFGWCELKLTGSPTPNLTTDLGKRRKSWCKAETHLPPGNQLNPMGTIQPDPFCRLDTTPCWHMQSRWPYSTCRTML